MELLKKKLLLAQEECATHLKRMSYAHGNISQFLPVTAQQLNQLDNEQVEALDQYIYIESVQTWLELRKFRNILAHEYANDDEEKANAINLVFGHFSTLQNMLNQFNNYLAPRLN